MRRGKRKKVKSKVEEVNGQERKKGGKGIPPPHARQLVEQLICLYLQLTNIETKMCMCVIFGTAVRTHTKTTSDAM